MGVGKHKDRIIIKGRTAASPDGYGGVVEAFATKWEGFASVEKVSGSRSIEAGEATLGSSYDITLRKKSVTILKTDIIEHGSRTYGVVSINDDEDTYVTIRVAESK